MKLVLWLFVCVIAVSPVFSGVCDPSCRLDPASKCLSTGKCLCWWGWTGTNAHYILTGFMRNRIVADKCDTPCSYSQHHRNQKCANVAIPKPPPPPGKCVVPHVNMQSTQVPCHPKCQPSGYQSNGRCLQNGRCLCFWGWTGTNACYVTNGKHKKQILADFCTIPCHYTHDYTNPSCLLTPGPTTANPSTSLSTQLTTTITTTQATTTEKVSTMKPTTYETTPEPTALPTTLPTDFTTDITNNPSTQAPPKTETEVPTAARSTTQQPTTMDVYTTASPSTTESTAEPTTKKPTTQQPSTQLPTTEEPTTLSPTTLQSTTLQTTTMQPTTLQSTTLQTTTMQPTTLQSTTLETTTMQPTTLQSTTLQPSTQEPTTTEAPTTKQPTTITTEQTTIATTTPETTTNPTTMPTTRQTTTEAPTTEEPEPTEPTEPGQFAMAFKRSDKKVSAVNQKSIIPMAIDNSKEASLLGIVSASLIIILIVFVTGWMMHKRFGRHAGYQRLII